MDEQKVGKADSVSTAAADHDPHVHVQSTLSDESDGGTHDANNENDANDDNNDNNNNDKNDNDNYDVNDDGDDGKEQKYDQTDNASLKMFKKKFMLKFNFTKMNAAFFMTHVFETGFLSNDHHNKLLIDTLAFFVSQLTKENREIKQENREMNEVIGKTTRLLRKKDIIESDLDELDSEGRPMDFAEF